MDVFFVSIGGALGAICRYAISSIYKDRMFQSVPVAIIVINLLGSFGLGISYRFMGTSSFIAPFIAVGFFGAFTTFSTFSMEALILLQKKRWIAAVCYVMITTVGAGVMFIIGNRFIQT